MKALQPKTIVLTGVTRGLGKALVERLTFMGHTIFGCGRNETLLASLRTRHPAPCDFQAVDVTDYSAVFRWFKSIYSLIGGPPDFLINNAAMINKPGPLWEVDNHDFEKLMQVNVSGTFNVLKAFVPWMVSKQAGVIVNLSSGWGRSTSPEVAPYCASKFAIEGMTLALAQELPTGMAAIPLNPGVIDTDMLRECFGSAASSYPGPTEWAEKAAPFILALGAKDNGKSLNVPL
jgi:NAD(P)-dependent dehydrogenase (short-subunit alcohol dehydrogenase family)